MIARLGDGGEQVGRVQQRLVELGYPIPQAELAAEQFGPGTEIAIQTLQREAGFRLVDGIVGPQTMHELDHPGSGRGGRNTAPGWRYDRQTVQQRVSLACDAAVGDIGLRESPDGSNDGPDLAKFKTRGAPWCALALSHWYTHADGGCPWGREASTVAIYEWARREGRVLGAGEPVEPGDVWFARRGPSHGHVALVVSVLPGGRLCCAGGNEGNAVRGSMRRAADATAILRPTRG